MKYDRKELLLRDNLRQRIPSPRVGLEFELELDFELESELDFELIFFGYF